jgi:hypothetical protein
MKQSATQRPPLTDCEVMGIYIAIDAIIEGRAEELAKLPRKYKAALKRALPKLRNAMLFDDAL